MFKLEYSHTDYVQLAQYWAAMLQAPAENGYFDLPPHFATGWVHGCNLPNGLSILKVVASHAAPFQIHRLKIYEEYYFLRLHVVEIPSQIEFMVEDRKVHEDSGLRSAIMLMSTMFEASFVVPEGFKQRSLYIMFSRAWLAQYLNIADYEEVLRRYLMMKTANINAGVLDAGYREPMEEVMNMDRSTPGFPARTEARVMMILERFFEQLKQRAESVTEWDLRHEDIRRVMQVEDSLTANYNTPPPTLEELAREAGISVSKLKRDFKQVFGLPPFEYYQKLRMNRARDLLLSGDYTVKEVGYSLGYANLSNFSYAFRKEFSVLPSEVII
jgi:AraC-like DNA-binding protein